MPLIVTDNRELEARNYVMQWFELLSLQQWHQAAAMLDEPNCYGVTWAEAEIKKALFDFVRGKVYSITSPASIAAPARISIGEFQDGGGFWLDCDVPVNGKWSDLTAQFEFNAKGNEYLVSLHDLHVL